MSAVLDASAVVAALVDDGPVGRWAEEQLASSPLVAPHLMAAEVANILRRATLAGELSADVATLAHADLLALDVMALPYAPFASRVWELRDTVTAYDAWYVAIAEHFKLPLVTLDGRLQRAPGPRCTFSVPPKKTG